MFVVMWEPKHGAGGGHQVVRDPVQAEQVSRAIYGQIPDAQVCVLTAEQHAALAVRDWQRRRSLHR